MYLLRSTILSTLLFAACAKTTDTVVEACSAVRADENTLIQHPLSHRSNSNSLSKPTTQEAVDANASQQSVHDISRSSVVANSSERMKGDLYDNNHQNARALHNSSSSLSGTAVLIGRDVKTIENILAKANAIEEDSADADDKDSLTDAAKSLKDLEEADSDPEFAERVILGPENKEIRNAIEEVSRQSTPQGAVQNGFAVTAAILEEVDGLSKSPPEHKNTRSTVEGDMIMNQGEKPVNTARPSLIQGIHGRFVSNLWPDPSDIPFCFSASIFHSSRQAFLDAVQHYHNNIPCVRFREIERGTELNKCAEEPAVFVKSDEMGCFANVGAPPCSWSGWCMQSLLNLQPFGCDFMGHATHELGHILGMLHEQSRTDHGQHVEILWNNIEPAQLSQFSTMEDADRTVDYDIMSIMHYDPTAFGRWGPEGPMQTIIPLNNNSGEVMGQRVGLTFADVEQVASMYGCSEEVQNFTLCSPDPDGCTIGPCVCHQEDRLNTEYVKVQDGNCSKCMHRCPDAPRGTHLPCACPEGCESGRYVDMSYLRLMKNCRNCQLSPAVNATTTPPPSLPDQPVIAYNGEQCLQEWTYRGATCSTYCCGWGVDQPWCYTNFLRFWSYCTPPGGF